MPQVLHIHGGEVYKNYTMYFNYLENYNFDFDKFKKKQKGWAKHLQEDLGSNYEVLNILMPNPRNAKYAEWKIWLEKFTPHFKDNLILTGTSLGATFWIKYLSENNFPVKISQLHLIAGPFDNDNPISPKGDSYDLMDFNHRKNLSLIEKQVPKIFIHHSKDDKVVTFEMSKKLAKALPSAKKLDYTDRGHFSIETFPEILHLIKNN